MIGRFSQRKQDEGGETAEPKGFDDFEIRLGDMMRGERATMGKSLLDVQRELRIKASYIAAIENSDPSAFDTPGFIAGYVRSYARYLNMDPETAFDTFCAESGFSVSHGMSAEASGRGKKDSAPVTKSRGLGADAFAGSSTPYVPAPSSLLSRIDPRAVGSLMVLGSLIGGITYGGWAVLKEVQQVQFAPVDQTPAVLADLDPLDSVVLARAEDAQDPAAEALDRLYRAEALDVPVLVARDAPISTLDPSSFGNFTSPELPSVLLAEASLPHDLVAQQASQPVPQVVAEIRPGVDMVAVRPSWVQVTAADGSVIFETIMDAGERFAVPLTEDAPKLRTGESSAIYFAVNGEHFGPVGKRGQVSKNIELSMDAITDRFVLADLTAEHNQALRTLVAELQTEQPTE